MSVHGITDGNWNHHMAQWFASLVAGPMSCFCLTCLPCWKSPCQLEDEALPTWRFTARRSLRSAASQKRLQLSGILEERSGRVACGSDGDGILESGNNLNFLWVFLCDRMCAPMMHNFHYYGRLLRNPNTGTHGPHLRSED